MGKHLPIELKGRVVGMSEAGIKQVEIAKNLDLKVSTVQTILRTLRERGTIVPRKSSGRPPTLSERDKRQLRYSVKKENLAPLRDIANQLSTTVSQRTLQRTLHSEGMFSFVAARKPLLTEKQKKDRLDFAKKHLNWTIKQWKKVIWTDEVIFHVGKDYHRVRVWRKRGEKYLPQNIQTTVRSGGKSVMAWGAFAGDRKSELLFFEEGDNTGPGYVRRVYDGELASFLPKIPDSILMEDGAPIHTCKAAAEWRRQHGIDKMVWPARSPDLNPIEHIWRILKEHLNDQGKRPSNLKASRKVILDGWADIPTAQLDRLIGTMPERMNAVIRAHGGYTRY
jgi:transposase